MAKKLRDTSTSTLPAVSRSSTTRFLARFARLVRYAVPQRVQNSRWCPHNGLKTRPTYAVT
jgi:hypothetical protein